MTHAQPTNSFLLHHSPYAFAAYLSAESRHLVSHAIKILFSTSFHKAAEHTMYHYIASVRKVHGSVKSMNLLSNLNEFGEQFQ